VRPPSTVRSRPALVELEGRDLLTFYGNQLFPLDNPWNQVVTGAPVAANSDAIISRIVNRHINPTTGLPVPPGLHPDFGNPLADLALYGIPVNVVDGSTPAVPVLISPSGYGDESDLVPVPIPANAVIEGDNFNGPSDPTRPNTRGDSHLIVYDKTANVVYELVSAARPNETKYPYGGTKPAGVWGAYGEAVWDLNTNTFRTAGWTSADAAGLPILTGLVRPDDALPVAGGGQGVIDHAIRVTVAETMSAFVYPASHQAGDGFDADLPRMGERFRLKAGFVIPGAWAPEVRAVAQAMKDYGLVVADNGSDMFFQGTPSNSWNMSAMLQLGQVKVTDFEVIDLTPVVTSLSITSGPAGGGMAVTITGKNFSGAAGQLHVLFGGAEAAGVTILSDTQVVAVAPPHAAGQVDVRVRSGATVPDADGNPTFFGYGTSVVVPADRFTFTSPPSPPSGGGGGGEGSSGGSSSGRPTGLVGFRQFVVAADAGGSPVAVGYNADGSARFSSPVFDPAFAGGVRTATADFTGDGVADVVVGTGPGVPARVMVLDGVTRATFFDGPVLDGFTGGLFVAAGDLTGDGVADVVATPDLGGGPRVVVIRGGDFAVAASFFGIDDPLFRGGARAAVGDLTGDGRVDLVIAAGFGGGPRVAGFDGTTVLGGAPVKLFNDLFVFEDVLRNGVYAAVGDTDGDGFGDLIAGAGPGGGPRVLTLSGRDLLAGRSNAAAVLTNFFGGDAGNRGGVRVAVKDLDGDRFADLVVGPGQGGGSRVTGYAGNTFAGGAAPEVFGFDAFPGFSGGVFVG
jgi:hypothetical protein